MCSYAPQFNQHGHGSRALHNARKKRNEIQTQIAKKIEEDRQAMEKLHAVRRMRSERVKKTSETINTHLNEGRNKEAQQVAIGEIRQLLGELPGLREDQDRHWVASKALHFTSWRGMHVLREVEEAFKLVFGDNIPSDLSEWLARLIEKQVEFLTRSMSRNSGGSGIGGPGKTHRERVNGKHARHLQNRGAAALEQRARIKNN